MEFEQVVPLKEIEPALAKILSELQGKNKTRACLFNLLIYTKENTREKYIQQVMQKIVERFPCRIILFIDKGAIDAPIKSTISVIEIKQGESQVFCDCIQFEMNNQDLKQIPFLTLPHLMPDLPTYMLWAEDPIKQDPLVYQLEKFCSRMIFDSEVSDQLLIFAKTALKFQIKTGIDIADLNWARTESFRDLLQSLFFAKKQAKKRRFLNATIIYNQTPSSFFCHTKIQAVYLAIWMAQKFGLELKKAESDVLYFKDQEAEITIKLQAGSHPSVTSGRILAIDCNFTESEHFLLKRKDTNTKYVGIYRTEKDFCEIPSEYLLDGEDSGASLTNEIFHSGTSEQFLKVLHFIGHQQLDDFC